MQPKDVHDACNFFSLFGQRSQISSFPPQNLRWQPFDKKKGSFNLALKSLRDRSSFLWLSGFLPESADRHISFVVVHVREKELKKVCS
jgi:hypothetical protein